MPQFLFLPGPGTWLNPQELYITGFPYSETLVDDFEDGVLDTTDRWKSANGSITESGGTANIPPSATSGIFRELKTAFGDYTIDSSYVAGEFVGFPVGSTGSTAMRIYLAGSGATTTHVNISRLASTDTLRMQEVNAGVDTGSLTSIPFDTTDHRWWAIVHRPGDGFGTFDWYTAASPTAAPPRDGSDSNGWTRRKTQARGNILGVDQQVDIYAVWTTTTTTGDFQVANVNTGWSTKIQVDRAVRYEVRNLTQSDRTVRYDIRNLVQAARDVRYIIFNLTQSDRAVRYDIRNLTQSDRAVRYDIRNLVQSDRTVRYDIEAAATTIQVDRAVRYDIRNLVQSDRTVRYDIRNLVQADRNVRYDIRNLTQSDRAVRYMIFNLVQSDRAVRYTVIERVLADRAIRYTILNDTPAAGHPPWLNKRRYVRNPDLPEL